MAHLSRILVSGWFRRRWKMASSVARGNPGRLARQAVDGILQTNAFGCGRCYRPDKSSGPPLLKLSLKVKRNNAHGQSSAFVVAPVSRPQRTCASKGPHCSQLRRNRRSRSMRPHSLHRYWMRSPPSFGSIFSSLIVWSQTIQFIRSRSGLLSSFIDTEYPSPTEAPSLVIFAQ